MRSRAASDLQPSPLSKDLSIPSSCDAPIIPSLRAVGLSHGHRSIEGATPISTDVGDSDKTRVNASDILLPCALACTSEMLSCEETEGFRRATLRWKVPLEWKTHSGAQPRIVVAPRHPPFAVRLTELLCTAG